MGGIDEEKEESTKSRVESAMGREEGTESKHREGEAEEEREGK